MLKYFNSNFKTPASHIIGMWMFVLCLVLMNLTLHAQQLAFPGAEGFGRYTTGGRAGTVIYVTNLNDAGAGSLRAAIQASGPRTIVFAVSGTIALQSALRIQNGDLTIAGQTAPGDGICIKNYPLYFEGSLTNYTNGTPNNYNVIVRYLRFRLGDEMQTEDDAFKGRRGMNIIIDHCSMSWSTDECASFYDNQNFTLQWSILSESLRVSIHAKGTHGYGGIWGGQKASFHHNLFAHHDSRNPRFCGSRYSNQSDLELVDFRNNVIYNWGGNSGYAGEGGSYNMVNNYYKPGPATRSSVQTRIFSPNADDGSNSQPAGIWGIFYVTGNYMNGSSVVNNDNWIGIQPNPSTKSKDELKSETEFDKGQIITSSAAKAFEDVMAHAGASIKRDTVDKRIISETIGGTFTYTGSNGSTNGLIDTQSDVGGWPLLDPEPAPADSDHDGMPDYWETANGLDFNLDTDRNIVGADGYTMLEKYLNSLVNWTPIVGYQLLTSVVGNGRISQANGLYEAGSSLELNAIPDEGWIFDSWSGDTTGASPVITLAMNSNKTITANFTLKPTSITDVHYSDRINTWCYPNPVHGTARIAFTINKPSLINICLFDIYGKQLKQITNEKFEPGINEVMLDANDIQPGIYLFSVTVGDKKVFNRITIINQ